MVDNQVRSGQDEEQWGIHKDTIATLYIGQNKSLNDIMRIMREDYRFLVTKAQLERHFKKWKLKKNRTKQDWAIVTTKVKKRKWEGKESEVYSYGKLIPPKRVCQEMSRSRLTINGASDDMIALSIPSTPDGIQISTPSNDLPHTLQIELPSYRLMNNLIEPKVWHTPYRAETSIGSVLGSTVLSAHLQSKMEQAHDSISRELIDRFMQAHQTLKIDSENSSSIEIDTKLFPHKRLRALFGEPGNDKRNLTFSSHTLPYIVALMFYLSNNLLNLDDEKCHIDRLLDMIQPADLGRLLFRILSTENPSAEAVADRIFRHSVVHQNIEVLQVLLHLRMDPNRPSSRHGCFRDAETPLCLAVRRGDLAMIRALIDHGANVSQVNNESKRAPLHYAGFHIETIQLLLEAGADVNQLDINGHNCIQTVFLREYKYTSNYHLDDYRRVVKQVIDRYSEKGLDLNYRCRSGCQILDIVVSTGDLDLIMFLLSRGVKMTDRTVYYAVQSGDLRILQFLRSVGIPLSRSILSSNLLSRTIYDEKFEMAEFLLARGAPVDLELVPDSDSEVDSEGFIIRESNPIHCLNPRFNSDLTPLQAACGVGRLDLVYRLISQSVSLTPPSLNRHLEDILTALSIAVNDSNLDMVTILLGARTGVQSVSHMAQESQRILTTAVEQEDIEIVHKLLEAGFGTPNGGSVGRLALSAAVRQGSKDLIVLFRNLKLYFDPRIEKPSWKPQPYQTPIVEAILTKNINLVVELLQRGVNVNNHSAKLYGKTALQAAVKVRNSQLIELLLACGADTDDPWALLHAITSPPNLDIVKRLINAHQQQFGRLRRGFGSVAMKYTARENNIDVLKYLVSAGFDLNERSAPTFGRASGWPDGSAFEEAWYTAQRTRDENAWSKIEATVLKTAISHGHSEMTRYLLHAGADPNLPATGDFGRTALQRAAESGNIAIVEQLLAVGCDVDEVPAPNRGVTALQAAAITGDIRIARLLISRGAEVNAAGATEEGRTALEGAAEHGRIDMLYLLLECGAEIHGHGKVQYDRSLELARGAGQYAAEKMLKRHYQSTILGQTTCTTDYDCS